MNSRNTDYIIEELVVKKNNYKLFLFLFLLKINLGIRYLFDVGF